MFILASVRLDYVVYYDYEDGGRERGEEKVWLCGLNRFKNLLFFESFLCKILFLLFFGRKILNCKFAFSVPDLLHRIRGKFATNVTLSSQPLLSEVSVKALRAFSMFLKAFPSFFKAFSSFFKLLFKLSQELLSTFQP